MRLEISISRNIKKILILELQSSISWKVFISISWNIRKAFFEKKKFNLGAGKFNFLESFHFNFSEYEKRLLRKYKKFFNLRARKFHFLKYKNVFQDLS